ncbi:unnamed protein product [Oppiella nova]|uniref:Major facilitator superfamily (MFS) profile domain-containing protein n=1 Tax=Oppiella nova TaxID=334625 RepID=A0A7R9LDD6_9ACAR|nr:unnamed protein product [Oppiella nova]CAG2162494.1 unnamed protein product [Oppiella nova]
MACLAAQMGSILFGCSLGWTGPALADMARSDMSVPTFVTEISTPNIRGLLGMAFKVFGVFGILYMDILSIWLPWNWVAFGGIIPSVLLSLFMFFIPESPNWLMLKFGRCLRVVEALHQLRHPNSDIDQELDELEEQVLSIQSQKASGFSIRLLARQDVYKPLIIGILLCFFQQFSGINAIQFYMNQIFIDSGSSMEPKYAVIVVNCSMFVATLIGCALIDRLGRKILLIVSGTGHAISLAVLGYYYYKNSGSDTGATVNPLTTTSTLSSLLDPYITATEVSAHPESSALPIICLGVFVSAYSIGFSSVIWIVITEICNTAYVGFIQSTCSVFVWLFVFVVTKEFEDLARVAHKYGAYWMFAGICVLSTLFIFYLPETKGQSIDEIQKRFYPKIYKSRPSAPPDVSHVRAI